MAKALNHIETRVLGCLIEKELSTPEYYPLTLNALVNACNQKSNRDPVMTLGEAEVTSALDTLRNSQLALLSAEGGRTPKYRHTLMERLRLTPAELALLSELLLRGSQTVGELRSRSERMHPFPDMASVEEALQELMERTPPMVALLPRMPGHKEQRYAHLFAGQAAPSMEECTPDPINIDRGSVRTAGDRIATLEKEVESIRAEVTALRRAIDEFKSQFE